MVRIASNRNVTDRCCSDEQLVTVSARPLGVTDGAISRPGMGHPHEQQEVGLTWADGLRGQKVAGSDRARFSQAIKPQATTTGAANT